MTERLTDAEIEELLALEAAATPGPWTVFYIASPAGVSERIHHESIDIAHIPMEWEKNGSLIAAARNALRPLVEELARLRELIGLMDSARKSIALYLALQPSAAMPLTRKAERIRELIDLLGLAELAREEKP